MASQGKDNAAERIDRRTILSGGVAAVGLGLAGSALASSHQEDSALPRIYRSEQGNITMAFAGDVMLSRELKPFVEDDYLALVKVLRGVDIAFCNLESTVRSSNEGVPGEGDGTPMTTPPTLLEDLKWMGFGAVSHANNHAGDFGQAGVVATIQHLRQVNLPFAGSGETLTEARRPVYVDTRDGRVGFVAASSRFLPQDCAKDPDGAMPARPGLNPLGFSTIYGVDDQAFAELTRIDKELGFAQNRVRLRRSILPPSMTAEGPENELRLGGMTIHRGHGFSLTTKVVKRDSDANLHAVTEAARQSDWRVFSLHCHEFGFAGRLTAESATELPDPADFWIEFAHAAIDAGADAVMGHGPHVLHGIEIYKGRPIFYSLGNFIFENGTIEAIPAETYKTYGLPEGATPADYMDARSGNDTRSFEAEPDYWESIVPVCEFNGRTLARVTIYPIDLGFGRPRSQRGRPVLAHGAKARRILERVALRSRQFGTDVAIQNEIGLVRVG